MSDSMINSADGSALADAPPPTPEVIPPLRHYLGLMAGMVLLVELNAAVLQMAVPALRSMAPHFPVAGLPWVLTVVTLVGAMLQPLGGKLADRIGLRPMILTVAIVFALGSLICAVTSAFAVLLIGRALQAVVLVMPAVAYRVYRDSLPARHVPIALGTLGTGIGVAGLIGPITAGALIDNFGYRALFWFFLVYVVLVTPMVYFNLPKSVERTVHRIDIAGGLLLSLGVGGLLLGVSEGHGWGWSSPRTVGSIVLGLILLGLFPLYERRQQHPLLDLSLLRRPGVSMTLLVACFGVIPGVVFGYAVPQMLQTPTTPGLGYAFGLTALAVGLAQIPYGLCAMILGPVGGALSRKIPVRTVMVAGLACQGLGLFLLALFHTSLPVIIVWMAITGAGAGLFWAALPNLVVEAVPAVHTGISGGIQLAVQATAASMVGALIGTILANNVIGVTHGEPLFTNSAFVTIYLVGVASSALGIVVTLMMRHGRRPATGGVASAAA
ncbi:MFS transporter [Nocardia vinacea]|uniref:MFS transporter n=1 Tax=Nocardia vinacea TaxID=96468 RepID=A0ABZ1YUR1_9NOCA|nr:MFS transporter [Nocardia vinacea]